MNVFNVRSYSTIPLGKQGENLAIQIRFPFVNDWRELYGDGSFQLVHQRRTDNDPYAVNVSIDGDSVVWNVTNTDVAVCGTGKCELIYIVNNAIAKSVTFTTKVLDSISHVGGTPPEPWQSWIEEVLQAGSQAIQAADRAETAKILAQGYAEEIENLTVSSHALDPGEEPTVTKTGGDGVPYNFDFGIPNVPNKPYVSLTRLSRYLYDVSFNTLPEYRELDVTPSLCSSVVSDGKLYRNLDWKYDHNASFHVRTAGFEGMAFLDGLTDISLDDELIGQLPYHVVDGVNEHGIMVSTHVLFNDWDAHGIGDISLTLLPYIVLTRVKSMATLEADLDGVLDNLHTTVAMDAAEYLIQVLVTDGTTSYILSPAESSTLTYEAIDISSNPKLTNFRWVSDEVVDRVDLQTRPTGVERWNNMTSNMSDLRFTKAYEQPTHLSEFIGIDDTTKYSTDTELRSIYNRAHTAYLDRERDGALWQTMHSVVYSPNGMEHLWVQEDWSKDYIAQSGGGGEGTSDHRQLSNRDAANQHPMSAITGLEDALDDKQTTITDLDDIRAGAALGETAVQTETDPTVPAWAKQPNKPSYNKADVGLGNVDNVRQYSASNPPPHDSTKQDTISDLATIRSGAALGATAVQQETGKGLSSNDYTTADKNKLAGIAAGAEVNVQADWSQSNTGADDYIKNKPTVPTQLSQLSADATHRTVTDTEKATWSGKSDFSGSYNDLTDKPTIPDELADLTQDAMHRTVTDTEKSTWNAKGTYSKPTAGIPKTDFTTAVQGSLDKADSALQEHQDISGKIDKSAQASKTASMTQAVGIDANGKLWTEEGGGTPYIVSETEPTDHGPLWIDPSDQSVPQGTAAEFIDYDNTVSGLAATDVQAAVDELASDKGAIKSALDAVVVPNTKYAIGTQAAVSIVLPSNASLFDEVEIVWYNGATAATLSITGTVLPCDYAPSANSRSEVNALWDGTYWAVVTNEQAVPEVTG